MSEHTISVALLPPTKNTLKAMHWHPRHELKQEWQMVLRAKIRAAGLPKGCAKVHCAAAVYWNKNGPLPDFHNLDPFIHEVMADALVECEVIEDDSAGRYVPETTQVFRHQGEQTCLTLRCEE